MRIPISRVRAITLNDIVPYNPIAARKSARPPNAPQECHDAGSGLSGVGHVRQVADVEIVRLPRPDIVAGTQEVDYLLLRRAGGFRAHGGDVCRGDIGSGEELLHGGGVGHEKGVVLVLSELALASHVQHADDSEGRLRTRNVWPTASMPGRADPRSSGR
jgi:hypothetical protein